MIIINQIDAAELDLQATLEQVRDVFGAECLPLNLPDASSEDVVDCFFSHGDQATAFSSVEEAHSQIVDQVVEVDEDLMTLYLEQGEELSPEQLHAPFEQALRERHLIPVCFTSGRSGCGVDQLLQIFTRLMPNPREGNPPEFLRGEGEEAEPVEIDTDPEKHVVAHVFKVNVDPYRGRLGIFRLHQGTLRVGDQLYVGDARKSFKVGHLLRVQGTKIEEVEYAVPGDLCAVGKVDEIFYDAVLHNSHDEDHYHLAPAALPQPMHGLAIAPARRGDEQKLSEALHRLAAEDPGLRIEFRAALNETVIYGGGDLHLRVVLSRLRNQFNADVNTSQPTIAYRETIRKAAEGKHRHKKQSGGAGQFGEVSLKVEPLPRGSGFEFVDKVVGGAIPYQFVPAVEKGVRQVMNSGAISGHPLQDIRVTVLDGKHHSVDSKEIAFVVAGRKALLDAIGNAGPFILEPIVQVQVLAPSANMGDITGDILSRRGLINGTNSLADARVEVIALLPQAELTNYQTALKSMTAGEGTYTMELSHYEAVPDNTQRELIAASSHSEREAYQ
jgi:elongation factor G